MNARRFGFVTEAWDAALEQVRALLIAQAQACATITYGELCSRVTAARLHPYSYALMAMLDAIGDEDARAGRAPLPTLVVRQSDGRPGPGYFRKSYTGGAHTDDLEAFWQAQFARVCAEWASP
jgi:hypothetical protein